MASKRLYEPLKGLVTSCGRVQNVSRVRIHTLLSIKACTDLTRQPFLTRSMATETISSPSQTIDGAYADAQLNSTSTQSILKDTFTQPPPPTPASHAPYQPPPNPFLAQATCTLHAFPSLEPTSFIQYPANQLLLPLRRDILHRAVVFEGDATRQGTASTKYRSEVHGSNRKIRPQKGLGKARLGDKKSPMLKGGGVAFGPKPRDFSTDLPKKIYDLAWRTALSYRYRRGELIIVDGEAEIKRQGYGSGRWMKELLKWNEWGSEGGRSLFVTLEERKNLFAALEASKVAREARALAVEDVDVKDLLELGRVVIEKDALRRILRDHSSDLETKIKLVA